MTRDTRKAGYCLIVWLFDWPLTTRHITTMYNFPSRGRKKKWYNTNMRKIAMAGCGFMGRTRCGDWRGARAPVRAVLTAHDASESIALALAERKSAETGKTVRL